jgi:prophage tail gpP-like protein
MADPPVPAGTQLPEVTVAAPAPTSPPSNLPVVPGRVKLTIDGAAFDKWTRVEITRNMQEIAGSFTLEYIDEGAIAQSAPNLISRPPFFRIVKAGMACTIAIDGELVLKGWIDDVDRTWGADRYAAIIQGRDATGDLVDCAVPPELPTEFSNIDLLAIAKIVCAPFKIPVRADIDVGAPFERLSRHPHENALPFLEKAARQRATLLVSDGVGGLLLTRGGKTAAPAPLTRPGNIQGGGARQSWRQRFSDYYVKGQTDGRAWREGSAPALDHSFEAGDGDFPPEPTAGQTVLMTGHAVDPEITRYRPIVRLTRSQSGMSTTQEQAEWALRVARGFGTELHYNVLDWRAGPKSELWKPNARAQVVDPYEDTDKEMLISGVSYLSGEQGVLTLIRCAGITAFDRINEAERRRHRHAQNSSGPLDTSFEPPKTP